MNGFHNCGLSIFTRYRACCTNTLLCFDRLSTNGKEISISKYTSFALSLSKGNIRTPLPWWERGKVKGSDFGYLAQHSFSNASLRVTNKRHSLVRFSFSL